MHCHLSEYSMHTQFVDGLKPEVQMHMLRDQPNNLDQLYLLAIDIDGRLYKMKKHLQDTPDSGFAFNYPVKPTPHMLNSTPVCFCNTNPDPDAMEVDVYSVLGSDRRLNNIEKACHKRLHLCLYCGQSGHQIKNCITQKGGQVGKTQTQIAAMSISKPKAGANSAPFTNITTSSNVRSIAGKSHLQSRASWSLWRQMGCPFSLFR